MYLKTEFQEKIEKRNNALFEEYKLLAAEGSKKKAIWEYLRLKYDFASTMSIQKIVYKMLKKN